MEVITMKRVRLYRPVGQKEWELIQKLEYRAYPPRLSFQPIFYPVCNEEYAVQIARDWNTKDENSGFVGYVTTFEIAKDYLARFEKKVVGADLHEEYWIPAEELTEFNLQIIGEIEVLSVFHGEKSEGF